MPEQIGKYHVLGRIGRGGMGMVFKAHDPVLDRAVALKVISPEVEVTDELRARFFREAQACARLSHPNIVTIYDMGEQDGRLFIVMELLDGDELRHLIARRTPLPLEDKLSVIAQICDGLHYAHEKGIVHRDVKPGNIFLLRSGGVKILDFGIAQMATTEAGLTRTGLIMGTLRYIAPEQVRGRATIRSDIYSVGAVCYELLGLRPPFAADDPIHLLEQLRSEEPTPLHGLDPSLPPELTAIVDRAMRKDANDRYADLAQMRSQVDLVRRGLLEEAQRLRARLREQLDEIFHLQRSLAERIGTLPEEVALPAIDDQGRLAAMQAIQQDFAARSGVLREKLARADALAPSLRRGNELLQSLQFADAVLEFEAILTEMPEHARAQEALRQAQAQGEEQRRQQLASELLHDAHAAFDDGSYALCLEMLKQVAEIPPHGAVVQEIASLRQAAEVAFESQEAARRERRRADQDREKTARARRDAEAQDAAQYSPGLFSQAESGTVEAESLYTQEAFAQASQAFELAATAYQAAEVAAREARAREREAAEQAGDRMAQRQQEAQAAGAPEYARDLWSTAESRSAGARATFRTGPFAQAIRVFDEASILYRQAAEVAARERDRQRAAQASERAGLNRQAASTAGAEADAATLWEEAEVKLAEAAAAVQQGAFVDALHGFDGAAALYGQAERAAVEVRRRQHTQAEQARQGMTDARHSAADAEATALSPAVWTQAEDAAATGEKALASATYVKARQSFVEASTLYRQAEAAAREILRRREKERTDAAQARDAASLACRAAAESQASKYAAKPWSEAEAAEDRAKAALSRQEYSSARSLFVEARRLYATATQAAGIAADLMARRVEAIMGDAERLFESRDLASCLRRVNEALAIKPGHPAAEALGRQAKGMLQQLEAVMRQAETEAQATAPTVRIEAPPKPPTPRPPPASPSELIGVPPAPSRPRSENPTPRAGTARPDLSPPAEDDEDVDVTVFALPRTGARASDLPITAAHGVEGTPDIAPTGTAKPRRLGTRAVLIALGVLFFIAAAIVYWWSHQTLPPRPTPGAGPRGSLSSEPPPGLEATDALRKQAVAAREETIQDEHLVPNQFAVAAAKANEGDAALKRGDFFAARKLYQEALGGYELARSMAQQKRIDVAQRGVAATMEAERAAEARKAAEKADAQKLAQALWAKAGTAQHAAEEAIKQQDFERAVTLMKDAQTAYQEAERVASDKARTQLASEERQRSAALERQEAEQQRLAGLQRQRAEGERQAAFQRQQAEAEQQRVATLQRQQAEVEQQRVASLERQRAEAEQARERTATARSAAEQSGAPRSAPKLYASGQGKEQNAAAAFSRSDAGTATRLFRDAEADYQQAKRDADGQLKTAALLQDAERAREQMTSAKRAAEQAGASRYAPKLLAPAQTKEQDAAAAMGRSDLPPAARLFREAEADYRAARGEAETEQRRVAAVRSALDQTRGKMLASRDLAIKVAAERLAKNLFDTAQAKQNEGDGLERHEDFSAAHQVYQDATERYREASLRAQEVGEAKSRADSARARMMSAKQRAHRGGSQFRAGSDAETFAESLYERFAFREAAETFISAEALFRKALPAPPPPSY